MIVFLIIVLVLVIGVVVAVVTGRVGADDMGEASGTSAFELPEGPLGERGVDAVRFEQSPRGYNMAQVDAVLDRLFDEIRDLRTGGATMGQRPAGRRPTDVDEHEGTRAAAALTPSVSSLTQPRHDGGVGRAEGPDGNQRTGEPGRADVAPRPTDDWGEIDPARARIHRQARGGQLETPAPGVEQTETKDADIVQFRRRPRGDEQV